MSNDTGDIDRHGRFIGETGDLEGVQKSIDAHRIGRSKQIVVDNLPHPLSFHDFHDIWVTAHSAGCCDLSARDAYDAYLSGISEAFQNKAKECPLDDVLAYVDLITQIIYMRRGNHQHGQG